MNGRIPADFQYSTTALAIVAMLAMPRLPTPMATREAGFSLAANGDSESCLRTSAGMSRIARSGKFWLTKRSRENCMAEVYQTSPGASFDFNGAGGEDLSRDRSSTGSGRRRLDPSESQALVGAMETRQIRRGHSRHAVVHKAAACVRRRGG